MAHGLAQAIPPEVLTVIVNIGDDFDHFGLRICPDLDTVCYTLAGLANPATGWGRKSESWGVFEEIGRLGGPTWFRLGDRDLGLHLERTRRLAAGQTLSQFTQEICRAWGIKVNVFPVSDQPVPTWVETDQGNLPFQEYFVRLACQPAVRAFHFMGVEQASPAPGVLEAIEQADAILIFPSNPWVSVDPIFAIPGILNAILERSSAGCPLIAVSPIIGGKTVKGPAAKMFAELGVEPSALAVARHYQERLASHLRGFVVDQVDEADIPLLEVMGAPEYCRLQVLATNILMVDELDRKRLALEILGFIQSLVEKRKP
jgi:LPPG:FO 2-phospho-L-lactate transferase